MTSIYLETERLLLRPPRAADIGHFVPLIGDFEVAKNLSRAPYPYSEDDGCAFIVKCAGNRARGEGFVFALLRKVDGAFIGMSGFHPAESDEMGYWIGKPFWGRGFATEAASRVAEFAFADMAAAQVRAGWFFDNPASGRVLEKLGFAADGAEERPCLSRGRAVLCHKVVLTRAGFAAR